MKNLIQAGRASAIAVLVIGGAVLLFTAVAHATFVIDDFSQPDPAEMVWISGWTFPVPDPTSPNPSHVETDDIGIMGGQRDLLVEVTGDDQTFNALTANIGEGILQVAAIEPFSIILQYDGIDTDTVGPPAELVDSAMSTTADLVTNPSGPDHEAFAFVFDTGGGPFDLTMIVKSPGGNVSTYTNTNFSVAAPATGLILFNDEIEFSGDAGWDHPYGLDVPDPAAADFMDVSYVEFQLVANQGQGFILRFVGTKTAVPEPGTILLAVFGGLCLVGCRRRRRHKA